MTNDTDQNNLDRRSFMKAASVTALAGAAGTMVAAPGASAQEGRQEGRQEGKSAAESYPRLSNGNYDFDTVYNRAGHNCARWDSPARDYPNGEFKYGMGVASMDFECAPCITEALQDRINHHSWGYMASTNELREEIVKWNGNYLNNDISTDMVVLSDGVYPGMIAAMRSFIPRGNKVLIPTPAYNGFYTMARRANIDTVDSQMAYQNGRYTFDWDDLEAKMTPDVRALIICNPQNPTGNVWREEELLRLGRMALERGIVVLSDEIHCDVIRRGQKFTPFAALPDAAVVNNSLTFTAISKTFNLAGMKNAYYYSRSPVMLERVNKYHGAELSTLGVVANIAAYQEGRDWFEQANAYMDDTHTFIENYVKDNMPTVGYTRNEGTYMTFLDFSKTMASIGAAEAAKEKGANSPEHYFRDWMVYNSGVYLNAGSVYGAGGEGHVRMNIASSRRVVAEVLDAMAAAVNKV